MYVVIRMKEKIEGVLIGIDARSRKNTDKLLLPCLHEFTFDEGYANTFDQSRIVEC